MIYHIYWGTSGNSGLYLDAIYKVLDSKGYKQRAFVNYYYPFDYGDKLFFKRGDVAFSKYKGKTRKIFQLIEVLKGYFLILIYSIKDKPQLINYSHAGHSFFFIPLFLKLLKKTSKAKLIITCHDVMPHGGISSEMKYRKKIFNIGDYLLVHNDNSRKELIEVFNEDESKIVEHLFPIMDLSKLPSTSKKYSSVDFLFIGQMRQEKGIQLLLDVWPEFHKIEPKATLRICGKPQPGLDIEKMKLLASNTEINLGFVTDEDYLAYVESARYVLLPYLMGSNSGVISTVLSSGADVITSDLPMFFENPLVNDEDMFICGNKESFLSKMREKFKVNERSTKKDKLKLYNDQFIQEVGSVYALIYNK
ncbi:predicted protein [Bacteroides intestinalis CAG:315]|uniref:Glycosyltransferase n=1 Tax=Bacteroides intestinalis TaxID=329854 RepID=A0A412XTV7_9BACE|nr:glycosyltransferase family 4 protein [Bacteroides intestinalis]RGV48585.1 glycosyltransferase [Bacteroides intestinalis]RHA60913.1 glycosyltransferase [Bacteroides intestinalis]CDD97620.1 predicted protein [Bacteroides intestinalis CAG:315]